MNYTPDEYTFTIVQVQRRYNKKVKIYVYDYTDLKYILKLSLNKIEFTSRL